MPGMNASVKFRDGQKPLFKLKMPVTMLGIPLQTGLTLGEGDDLGVHLGTAFEYGPTWRLKYRPNDGGPPALEVKTGLGRWGSNKNAAFQLSAEWDLADLKAGGGRFMLRVKPRLGDFSLRHSTVSGYSSSADGEEGPSNESRHDSSPDSPASRTGSENGNASEDSLVVVDGADSAPPQQPASEGQQKESEARRAVQRSFDGIKRGAWFLNVHSRLPLGSKANARVRWSVKVPKEMFSTSSRGFGALNLEHRPTLFLEKLSIETKERRSLSFQKSIYEHKPPPRKTRREPRPALEPDEIHDMKEELSRVKSRTQSNSRGIQKLESENFDLRSAVNDLKAQFAKASSRGGGQLQASSPASVILREEAMLRAQLKHLDEEEEKGRQEKPRQPEQRRPRDVDEDRDEDESSQDSSDISARLRQALMQREGRR